MADSYLYPGSCGSRMGNGNDRGDVMPHSDIYWDLWDGPSSSGREKQRSSKSRTSLLYRLLVIDTRWYIPAEDRRLESCCDVCRTINLRRGPQRYRSSMINNNY